MTRRTLAALVAAAALVLLPAAAAPRAEAISFVDKQVQAGGLLIQNYVNKYGAANKFVFPPRTMVKKGGGLPDSTLMWPANPWTGRTMASGTSRGTYTYTHGAGGISYKLTMHFSRGSYVFRGSMPTWLKNERDTGAKQNLLLLQRYVESYASSHGGYPVAADVDPATFSVSYAWPKNPWTEAAMTQSADLGDFAYAQKNAGAGYQLSVHVARGEDLVLTQLAVGGLLSATPAE
jgi:hypothetical protein